MIGLVVFIFGAVGLINNIFQNYVFRVNYNYYAEPVAYPFKTGTCYMQYPDPTDTEGKRMITPTAEESAACEKSQKDQQDQNNRNTIGQEFSIAIAQLLVGLPVWLFHWGIIQKEYRRKEEEIKP